MARTLAAAMRGNERVLIIVKTVTSVGLTAVSPGLPAAGSVKVRAGMEKSITSGQPGV